MSELKTKSGGPAFPVNGPNGDWPGMDLRDYFAAKADGSGMCPHDQYDHDACAKWAMDRADAMLKARSQT